MARDFLHGAACGSLMLAAAALTTMTGAGLQPAWADGIDAGIDAGLGGGCCADLEARVAELEATTVRKGNRRVSLTLSGQVTRSLLYWDDGNQADLYSVDNGLNSSRFRMTGGATIAPALTTGFLIEIDIRIGARSNQVTQIDDDGFSGAGGILGGAPFGDGIGGNGDSVPGIRQANWWVDSTHYGRLTVGRINSATAGVGTINLSNMIVVVTSEPGEFQGAFLLRNGLGRLSSSSWTQLCGGPSAAGPYSAECAEFGASRRDGVRYDTPTFWGFKLSGVFGEDDFWDVAARYSGEFYGFRVAGGVGYRWQLDREPDVLVIGPPDDRLSDTDRRHWLSSVSVMHVPTGLFVSGAYTNYEFRGDNANELFAAIPGDNRPDIPLWWVGAGIEKNWTGLGATTFYGEWGRHEDGIVGLFANDALGNLGPGPDGAFGDDLIVLDSEVEWWGAGVVQAIDAAAMEFYVAYRQYEADARIEGDDGDQIPGGLQDIWFIQTGARIRF